MANRDTSIDILKCLAAIIITNSHMNLLYGSYSMLATGGAIGDALFFFCSGFTLFLGRKAVFFNWYKRRIRRIYPTIFAFVIVSTLFGWRGWDCRNICDVLVNGGGRFVTCIMMYYVALWIIRCYMENHLPKAFFIALAMVFAWYYAFGIDAPDNNMYGGCYFKWVHYFLFMLLGAVVGYKKHNIIAKGQRDPLFLPTLSKLILSVACFYILCWFKNKNGIYDFVQMSSLIPLMGITYYLYQLCNNTSVKIKQKLSGIPLKVKQSLIEQPN